MNTTGKRQAFIGIILLLSCILLLLAGCGGSGGSKPSTPVLKKIEIQPATVTVQKGGTHEFTAVGKDQNGKAMTINPAWSVTGGVGTVSPQTGVTTTFTAIQTGSGTIVAKVGDISGSAGITVSEEEAVLTTLEISPSAMTFSVNTSKEFTATGYDQFGNELSTNPTWSVTGVAGEFSPPTGTTVSFTPTSTGTGTVTASEGDVCGTAAVTITNFPSDTIRVGVDKDFATIQEAIDAADDEMTIIVDEGTYTENLTIDKSITLRSTDPDTPSVVASTIINGGGSGTVWIKVSGNEPTVNIEGFTITGGSMGVRVSNSNTPLSVSLEKNVICGNHGYGGVSVVQDGLQLMLEDNTIENNSTDSEGGGLCLNGSYDDKIQVTMFNNIIRNNSADGSYGEGGGIYARYVEGTWTGNTIDGNSATVCAGGIYLYDSSPTIEDNEIINNKVDNEGLNRRGGGIYIEKSVSGICNPTIQNNTISGNVAQGSDAGSGGGLYIDSASPGLTLTENTISENAASLGAGILTRADTTFTNNTISGNTASESGGGLGVASGVGVVTISGNNFTGNTAPQGGGVYVGSDGGELTGSGNSFNNNQQYAIYLHWAGATWADEGGNTFSGNTPGDVFPPED